MQKVHNDKWFKKQEARLEEPFRNTKLYHGRKALLMLTVGLPTIFLPIWGVIKLIKLWRYIDSFYDQTKDYMFKGRMIKNVGPPGCGKTFTGSNIAYSLALKRWEDLKTDYFTARSMVKEWVKNADDEKLIAYDALRDSYLFFKEREDKYVPCLLTTIPLREYKTGRMSYQLTPDVYAMVKRIPEYTVMFNDETGASFNCHDSMSIADDVQDFMRFIRQMLDAVGINTEQGDDGDAKAFRKSTDYNNYLGGQEWLMKPSALMAKFQRRKDKYLKKLENGKLTDEQAVYKGQELYYIKEYIKTIGFRRIPHELKSAGAGLYGNIKEDYIFPAIGCVQYSDRAFRSAYKCKDQTIELDGWTGLLIEDCDLHEFDKLTKKQPKEKGKDEGNGSATDKP